MQLPKPDPASLQHSLQLQAYLADLIQKNGSLSFNEYMRLALYTPRLGYYMAGAQKFGVGGDFVTAPELSSLFSWCVARQCQEIHAMLPEFEILELGAGSGKMALEILRELQRQKALPQRYLILELSADLKERQRQLFQKQAPEFLSRLQWLDALPAKPITGIILANEIIDAMPIHRFQVDKEIQEFYVDWRNEQFIWELRKSQQAELIQKISSLNLPQGYCSEINLILNPWLKSLAQSLEAGILLLIDYGYVEREYYHPERTMGTLLCHYQHFAHDDPLIFPGIQDITASVNFTAVAEAAVAAGFDVAGFINQAGFLINLGLTDFLANFAVDEKEYYAAVQQVKRLTLPTEMGERFKVLALSKNYSANLQGFCHFDQTTSL